MQRVVKKIGHHEVMDRWINPEFLKANILINLFSLLLLSEVASITAFANVTRLENDIYINLKQSVPILKSGTFGGGVPPDIVSDPPSPDQIVDFVRIVDQFWSKSPTKTDKLTIEPIGYGRSTPLDAEPAADDEEALAKEWADSFRASMAELCDG